jgi:ferric-dicitrate binding protein FerR (iron transport regulator)
VNERDGALPPSTQRWLEALTWHETLTEADASELTSSVVRDWQAWYAEPENERVFDKLIRLTADGRAHGQRKNMERSPHEDDPVVSMAAWRVKRSSKGSQDHSPSAASWRSWSNAAIVIAAMIAVVTLILGSQWVRISVGAGDGSMTYQTGVGGLRDLHLADGSNIELGGSTELVVTLSRQVRSVQLIRGEAWFRVAHDPKWPFVVKAGDRDIRAVGTAFLVTRESDRVVVTVTEGAVSITGLLPVVRLLPLGSRGAGLLRLPAPIRVTRGQKVDYRDSGTAASVGDADTHAATAWTHGRLVFDDEPLRYVIENVNRYFPRRMSATASAGRLRFSGVILVNEIDDWLRGLSRTFPVDVVEDGSNTCIRMRARELSSPAVQRGDDGGPQ